MRQCIGCGWRVVASLAVIAMAVTVWGGTLGCGGGKDTAVAASIIMADGTTKDLDDTPIPLNIRIKLVFTGSVDPALAEPDIIFTMDDKPVPYTIAWQLENTEAILIPHDALAYGTEYRVAMNPDAVVPTGVEGPPSSLPKASVIKAGVAAIDEYFTTMKNSDVNGDGRAELITHAPAWAGGMVSEGGSGRGRGYLFYGNDSLASGSATTATAIIDGMNNDDGLFAMWSRTLDFDVNDDGYADAIYISSSYAADTGRTYIFFGGDSDAPITGALAADAAPLILTGAAAGDTFSAFYVGDVNGDGYSDLVGNASRCAANTGCLYIFLGPDVTSRTAAEADAVIAGEAAGDLFGMNARIADVNGDGLRDIVASAVGYTGGGMTGRIYVFYGRSAWTSMNASAADVIITGENAGDLLLLADLADVNGDGTQDILASAFGYDGAVGRAYIFYGGSLAGGSAAAANLVFTGEAANDLFGWDLMAGDVNGDGTTDVLVGARGYPGAGNQGRIYGFLGGAGLASKNAASADFILTGESGGDQFQLQALGDVNDDGVVDVITDAQFYSAAAGQGRTYIFFGGSSIASAGAGSANAIFTGENVGDHFGFHRLIDFNGDGVMDIVAGASTYLPGNETGREYLFFGGSGITSMGAASANTILTGENSFDDFGE